MNAVIYARYSSDNQREESIEGQLRECTAYAEKNNITIIRTYIDRALSARTDDRPDFQCMIRDSEQRTFDTVLVWKLDRFSRDRYDSAFYKHHLKKNGVRVVSVTENISDGPEGIILESMLEGMAEYYSAELAVKVRRGQYENAIKCRTNGGTRTLGYTVNKDGHYEINPVTAPIVREIYSRYDSGETIKAIVNSLNKRGIRNQLGTAFTISALGKIIRNRKYIGEYRYGSTVVPGGIPAIIDPVLFERVQQRVERNKKAPATAKANDAYLLTTKLFCGNCGRLMAGESGTARNGTVHYYYKCGGSKRHLGCNTKAVKKEYIEKLVVMTTVRRVLCDEEIDRIADSIVEMQKTENPILPTLNAELKECERKIDNLMEAIMDGIRTSSTKEKLAQLEARREDLQVAILQAKLQRPVYTKDQIVRWINRFKGGDVNDRNYQRQIIDVFLNAVYLYSDKLVFTYNYKDGTETVSLKDIELALSSGGSDFANCAPPEKGAVSLTQ